jgi:hypothetical protein
MSCPSCGKTENLKACAACKKTSYCSVACQKGDWGTHKKWCKQNQAKDYKVKRGKPIERPTLTPWDLSPEQFMAYFMHQNPDTKNWDFSEQKTIDSHVPTILVMIVLKLLAFVSGVFLMEQDEESFTYIMIKNVTRFWMNGWAAAARVEWCMGNSNMKIMQFLGDPSKCLPITVTKEALDGVKKHLEAFAVKTGKEISCYRGTSKIHHGYICTAPPRPTFTPRDDAGNIFLSQFLRSCPDATICHPGSDSNSIVKNLFEVVMYLVSPDVEYLGVALMQEGEAIYKHLLIKDCKPFQMDGATPVARVEWSMCNSSEMCKQFFTTDPAKTLGIPVTEEVMEGVADHLEKFAVRTDREISCPRGTFKVQYGYINIAAG